MAEGDRRHQQELQAGNLRYQQELQAQRAELLAMGNSEAERQLLAWQQRMQQQQTDMMARMQLVADRNSTLESTVSNLQSQLQASQDVNAHAQQIAVLTATSMQDATNELGTALVETAEMRQSLLNTEIELSRTVSSYKTHEAQAQRKLQLAEESLEQRARQELFAQRTSHKKCMKA